MTEATRLPGYFLTRPPTPTDEATIRGFERLWAGSLASGTGGTVPYTLSAPKWQFLCWLTDTRDVVLHGSATGDIAEFEPRLPGDSSVFGNRQAVFAASDGIWAMFFAVIDRAIAWSLVNACFSVVEDTPTGHPETVRYYFSINADGLRHRWSSPGFVHVLPRRTFEQQPEEEERSLRLQSHQWASLAPVRPYGAIAVDPEDFPFLDDVHGHDPQVVKARAVADPNAFPWRDDTSVGTSGG